MLKKLILLLGMLYFLGGVPKVQATASVELSGFSSEISFIDSTMNGPHQFLTKKNASYDESKDPALRQGTENWEEPQGSFFIVPALVLGIIGLVLFFNKK